MCDFSGFRWLSFSEEVSLLRDELEMAQISEEENSAAECAVLRSLRQEIVLQRQHYAEQQEESYQRTSRASCSPNTSIDISASPQRSLHAIVAEHSHPKSEVAQLEVEERCSALRYEMHVQDRHFFTDGVCQKIDRHRQTTNDTKNSFD